VVGSSSPLGWFSAYQVENQQVKSFKTIIMITKKNNNVKDYSAATASTQNISEGFAETIYQTSVQGSRLWGRTLTGTSMTL